MPFIMPEAQREARQELAGGINAVDRVGMAIQVVM